MSSLDLYKSRLKVLGNTAGMNRKTQSDVIMEQTWNNDIQTRTCYLYDYFHDRDSDKLRGYDPSTDVNKFAISCKFIIYQYGTVSKDQVEYHLTFKPSQKTSFTEEDFLYYYETNFTKRYGAEFPIGMYVDIPDDTGVYRKWIIASKEISNQFPKYTVLPCNYNFKWIEVNDKIRYKRHMWGLARFRNSYSSGIWSDDVITVPQNQDQFWLPSNTITDYLYYDQRIIISDPTYNPTLKKYPLTWRATKVENIHPLGLKKFIISQDKFDTNKDYVELDVDGNVLNMYADYYVLNVEPEDDVIVVPIDDYSKITFTGTAQIIKVGGGYKTFTATYYDSTGVVINTYTPNWSCYIDGTLVIDDSLLVEIDIPNKQYKVKINNTKEFNYGDDLIGKVLTVYCDKGLPTETMQQLDILAL